MFNFLRCIINIMQISSSSPYTISTNSSLKQNQDEEELQEEKNEEEESAKAKSFNELTQEEKNLVLKLQTRDAEVRAHEAAHQSGGTPTGAASFTYQQGPDGKMYAIGGEVPVTMQSGSTPEETVKNAREVIATALAPADPSAQDMAIASSATIMMMKAEQQIAREEQEEMLGKQTYKNEALNNEENKEYNTTQYSAEIDTPA